ncbi:hypothetical protein Tco_0565173 [Tanacetum coccineum]
MGIDTRPEEVDASAKTMGCLIFTTPFVHLELRLESLEDTDEFSVIYVRQLLDDSILPNEEFATWWVKVMPIKINVFAWRVRLDKLSTRLNLSLKGSRGRRSAKVGSFSGIQELDSGRGESSMSQQIRPTRKQKRLLREGHVWTGGSGGERSANA